MKTVAPLKFADYLEDMSWLDKVAGPVSQAVHTIVRPQWLRDMLHGVPLGHPMHPLLVQVPIGAWISAALLDLLPGTGPAATVLVGTGIAAAVPAAATGYTDWSDLLQEQQRVGVVHSTANLLAVGLYAGSLLQRCTGQPKRGKLLGYAGLAVVMTGGFLGGHLVYRQAAGANHAADVPALVPSGWHGIGSLDGLPDGELSRRELDGVPLLVLREGTQVQVLADTCSHLSGPLHEGQLVGGRYGTDDGGRGADADGAGDPCVVCPWHKSTFSLRTGEVVHGPATAPQPRFLARVVAGQVEVCLPGAG